MTLDAVAAGMAAGCSDVEPTGPVRLHLQTTRTIEYTIYNSLRPIFRLDEPLVADVLGDAPIYLIVDEAVMRVYGSDILRYFHTRTDLRCWQVMSGAETAKSLAVVERLCDEAVRAGIGRRAIFVGVGGGVVLDVVGVAASLYRRGMSYVRIPTTLIGLVDVAVGIKHAVNFGGKKNALGSFFPPIAGIVDRTFLQTLDDRHISCGLAEIIKMAVVRDEALFEELERHGPQLVASKFATPIRLADYSIVRAQTLMMEELQPNLFEEDLRRLVDFGHTFSSVLESRSEYALPHGEAVAIDMLLSTAIATVSGTCNSNTFDRLVSLCSSVRLPLWNLGCTKQALLEGLQDARRHRSGKLNLVVPTRVGSAAFMQVVTDDALHDALQLLRSTAADIGA